MSADIHVALSTIEEALRRLSRPTIDLLNPGIEPEAATTLLTARGLVPEPDVLALWAWRDGTSAPEGKTLGDMWLVPGFYLASAQEATVNFDRFVSHPRWTRTWLPLFANGGGDFLAVDLGGRDNHGAVFHFRIDESEHPVEYQSVERMIATFAEGFRRSAFYVDTNGWLEEDPEAYAAIAAELNPEIRWWTDPIA